MRLVQASSFFPSQVVATQAKTAANKTHTVKTNPPSNNMQKQHASKNMYQKHAINVIKFKLIYFYLTYLNIIIFTESKSISVPGGYESGGWADFDEKYGLKAYVLKVIVSPLLMIFKVHS